MSTYAISVQWIGRFIRLMFLFACVAAALAADVAAHEGPTDISGCHFSETRGYHCH